VFDRQYSHAADNPENPIHIGPMPWPDLTITFLIAALFTAI